MGIASSKPSVLIARCARARRARRPHRRGFSLIDAAMTTVIIGLGVVAIVELLMVGTMSNSDATELTTATHLANNIGEWSLRTRYADLHTTFNDKSFTTPKDALGADLPNFDGWSQVVDVQYVDRNHITRAVGDAQAEPTSRVVVTVQRNGRAVLTHSYLRCSSRWPLPQP
jgi:Tfp pilus assembly protein PilV